ncbi:DUF1048 domain-containing protein [Clostridium sp. JNZ X4-2]
MCLRNDWIKIHYNLIELFEAGAAEGESVQKVSGDDIKGFCSVLA